MKKRIVCLTLALMMTATQVVSVSASREDELREEQAATSAQLDATYAQIDQLYSAKQQLQDEINSLDANLVNVMVSIQTLEGDISNKEADIQQTQADLQKAQNAKDKQYAAMKQRIQYLYEKGGNEAWFQMMMSADNLSDLLTKAEYTQKMYDYDRQSLEKYANTITQVTNLGNQYQQEKAELEGMKQEYEAQSVDLQNQIDTKKANSADCDNEIAYAQEMANEYANLIQEQQAEIEQLEAERIAAEEEARRQAEAEAAAAAAAQEAAQNGDNSSEDVQYDEDGNVGHLTVILKDSTGQSRELNEEEITDLYKKQEIKRLEKESYAQCLLDYIDGLTSKEAVNSVEYGDELTGKYLEKYNEKVSNTQSYIEKVISGKKAVVDQAKIASLTNTDAQAVEVKGLYADWEDDPDGYAYDVQNQKDKRRNFGGFLWNLNKNHQKQKDRFPGAEPTLWTQLVEGYEGSYSDPIPVPDSVNVSGFEYEYGKYYIENELVYLCKRGGVLNPESMYGQKEKLYFKPSALIGQYFEIA